MIIYLFIFIYIVSWKCGLLKLYVAIQFIIIIDLNFVGNFDKITYKIII